MSVHKLSATVGLALLAYVPRDSYAQNVRTGTGVWCNTMEQMEDVIRVEQTTGNLPLALAQVNRKDVVCAISAVAYIKDRSLEKIKVKQGVLEIAEVTVIAVENKDGGIFQNIPPRKQVTAFVLTEHDRETDM